MPKSATAAAKKNHQVVSPKDWTTARRALLVKEKEFSRAREDLARQRRELPWEKVDQEYVFDAPGGRKTLGALFGKNSQLIVYHFMFAPEDDEGCPHCSFWADHYDAVGAHLHHHDVSFAVISRAPAAKLEAFKKRMGWKFKWVSSGQNRFNYDFGVSFTPDELKRGAAVYNYRKLEVPPGMDMTDREGISVFFKDETGTIYHTYSCYARGIDMVNGTYQFLDLTPKGRNEDPDRPQGWVRYHDQYED